MQAVINLTPVLVTLIICTFLYAICKMARQDEKKQPRQKEVTDLREYVAERIKENTEK